jgi:hypothetical protein
VELAPAPITLLRINFEGHNLTDTLSERRMREHGVSLRVEMDGGFHGVGDGRKGQE